MESILESTILEYKKSTFLIDLMQHNSGLNYVLIKQIIEGNEDSQVIKIASSALHDIIYVLDSYYNTLSASELQNDSYFSVEKQKSITERYFKGLNIEELATQFDCRPEIIIQILRNKDIPIINNTLPESFKKSYYKKKRK